MLKLGPYSKFFTGVVGQALTYATLYYGGNKYVAAAVAVAASLGVYAVPNAAPKGQVLPPAEPPAGM